MRKILCFTGTRADFPRVRPVLDALQQMTEIDLRLFVTGQHMLDAFGNTLEDVKHSGVRIADTYDMYQGEVCNDDKSMALAVARALHKAVECISEVKPDLALVTVDRVETLAFGAACLLMNIPIAHIQGGELTGTVDESIRHAISKMAHIHFPANLDAENVLKKMGENPKHIFNYGCPYVDTLLSVPRLSREELMEITSIEISQPFALVVFHPVTTEPDLFIDQLDNLRKVLRQYEDIRFLVFKSNNDSGASAISDFWDAENVEQLLNFPDHIFINLLMHCEAIVGNSSVGIREAPYFGIPAINIGSRQDLRTRGSNVLDAPDGSESQLLDCFESVFRGSHRKNLMSISQPYGMKGSAKKIAAQISKFELNRALLNKRFYFS